MSEASNRRSEPDVLPYYERICKHGKSFAVHCKECQLEGFCGCPDCTAEDKA